MLLLSQTHILPCTYDDLQQPITLPPCDNSTAPVSMCINATLPPPPPTLPLPPPLSESCQVDIIDEDAILLHARRSFS
jgi:hypothetical protein